MKAQHPELPIVMISGHGNIETAVAAIKRRLRLHRKAFKATGWSWSLNRALRDVAAQARGQGAQALARRRWSASLHP